MSMGRPEWRARLDNDDPAIALAALKELELSEESGDLLLDIFNNAKEHLDAGLAERLVQLLDYQPQGTQPEPSQHLESGPDHPLRIPGVEDGAVSVRRAMRYWCARFLARAGFYMAREEMRLGAQLLVSRLMVLGAMGALLERGQPAEATAAEVGMTLDTICSLCGVYSCTMFDGTDSPSIANVEAAFTEGFGKWIKHLLPAILPGMKLVQKLAYFLFQVQGALSSSAQEQLGVRSAIHAMVQPLAEQLRKGIAATQNSMGSGPHLPKGQLGIMLLDAFHRALEADDTSLLLLWALVVQLVQLPQPVTGAETDAIQKAEADMLEMLGLILFLLYQDRGCTTMDTSRVAFAQQAGIFEWALSAMRQGLPSEGQPMQGASGDIGTGEGANRITTTLLEAICFLFGRLLQHVPEAEQVQLGVKLLVGRATRSLALMMERAIASPPQQLAGRVDWGTKVVRGPIWDDGDEVRMDV